MAQPDEAAPARGGTRKHVLRVLTGVFVVIAIAAFVYAMVKAWDDTGGVLPSAWRLALAVAMWVVGLSAGALGWTLLLGDHRYEVGAGFVVSQLGKYVPGGVFQAAGQVGMAKGSGVEVRRSVVAFTVGAVVQAATGGYCLVLLAITWTNGQTWVRALCVVGALASVALLDRRWMCFVLHRIPRTRGDSDALVPPQRALFAVSGCMVISLLASAGAYLVLLGTFGAIHQPGLVIAAFITAWTSGFVVVPIPSGLGIREAVLTGLLVHVQPASVLVAASGYHRLATVAAEGIMALAVTPGLRRARRRTADARTAND